METKTFMTISKEECLSAYKEILENAELKWSSAAKLAQTKDYGTAVSVLFISTEELIKALIVFFDGHGFEFRSVKGIETIFKNHSIRYIIAYAMFVMAIIGDDIQNLLKRISSDPATVEAFNTKFKPGSGHFERKMKYYLLKKLVLFKSEFKWFSSADIFRQSGLYCDYSGSLNSPLLIDEQTYSEVFKRIKKVRKVGHQIIYSFMIDDEGCQQQLIEMKAA